MLQQQRVLTQQIQSARSLDARSASDRADSKSSSASQTANAGAEVQTTQPLSSSSSGNRSQPAVCSLPAAASNGSSEQQPLSRRWKRRRNRLACDSQQQPQQQLCGSGQDAFGSLRDTKQTSFSKDA